MALITDDLNQQQIVSNEGVLPAPAAPSDPYAQFKLKTEEPTFRSPSFNFNFNPPSTSMAASRYGDADTSGIPSEALGYSGVFSAPGDDNAITAPQSATNPPEVAVPSGKRGADKAQKEDAFSFLREAAFSPKQGAKVYYVKLPNGKEVDTTDVRVADQAKAKGLTVEVETVDWTAPGYYDEQRFFKELDRRERALVRETKDTTDPTAKRQLSRLDRIAAYYDAMNMEMPASAPDLIDMARQELAVTVLRAGKNQKEAARMVKNPIIKDLLENNVTPKNIPEEAAVRWLIDQYGASKNAPARYRIGDITKFNLIPIPKKSGDRVAIPTQQAVTIDSDE